LVLVCLDGGVCVVFPSHASGHAIRPVNKFGGTVRHFFLAICFTLVVGLFHIAFAQDVAGIEEGIKPYGSYHGGDIDSVSMSNLNPGIHIPLITYPQRGGKLNVGFEVVFNNPSLIPHVLCYPYKPYTCYDVSYTWYNSYFGAGGTVVNGTHAYIVPTFTRAEGCSSYNQSSPVCPKAPYEAVDPRFPSSTENVSLITGLSASGIGLR
jgi:hypothetical protein